MFKIAAMVGGILTACVLGAGIASADDNDTDVEGGDCHYDEFSINIMPSCDTSNDSDGKPLEQVIKTLEPAGPDLSDTF